MDSDIVINKDIYLTKSSRADKPFLVEFLNDEELYNQTLRVPKPYTESDADDWFNFILTFEEDTFLFSN